MFFVCVTVGLVILASKYHNNVFRSVKKFCHNIASASSSCPASDTGDETEFPLDKVILADSPEKCDYAVQRIRCDLSNGVLGFDCEWVNEGAVALLQLATFNGVCALFRLGKIGYVPPKLKELLSNKCILKVGVAPFEDGRKLTNDYGCRVFGTVDLRTLADRLGVPSRKSLAALTLEYLNVEMDKILEVRCGDWNADILTNEQTAYAAYDAIASVLIYHKIQQRAKEKRSMWKNCIIYIKSVWSGDEYKRLDEVPEEIIDVRFKPGQSEKSENNNNQLNRTIKKITCNVGSPRKSASTATRKEPLYHNCYLEAPDGEILCTCDRKKAEWYVSKDLGTVVNDTPFTVRLNFEPSGRAFGQVGQYYTQVKINQCVVCGSTESFIKKNVVPREYRKYFPLVMKAHQSHDVLLLCPDCHEISNRRDLELRRQLAEMCDAPLIKGSAASSHGGPVDRAAGHHSREWTKFLSALKALKDDAAAIPPRRRQQLETEILEYTGLREFVPGLPNQLYQQFKNQLPTIVSSSPLQGRCQPHGMKVVSYFTNCEGGLVTLEKMWREHFLENMKPRYLPKLWSVSHNQERLVIRQTQNRIEPQDARLAGITEQTVQE